MHCSKTNDGGNVRSVFLFQSRRRRHAETTPICQERSPVRLSRLMALAIRFEDMLREEDVVGYSELSARYGVDRGRISRIMNLRLLATDLQEKLLSLEDGETELSLKRLLPVCKLPMWSEQRVAFAVVYKETRIT
ncbi:hypothetical protein H5P28_04575 [Ruficoccus amylovorans]|uniref:Uncharacterized protein n=1 Tax=Ruficoccus amylovorans TaxID=1804625 RepID=A0A842HDV5_9BACT|nr:hypothetical protein [Ruficoccus amylovorans]MBC2593531.1 hypothetical protein [Ruficoccus amylovorans]